MINHAVSKMTTSFGIDEITFNPTGESCFLLVFSETIRCISSIRDVIEAENPCHETSHARLFAGRYWVNWVDDAQVKDSGRLRKGIKRTRDSM
jgi:hypothetical protein